MWYRGYTGGYAITQQEPRSVTGHAIESIVNGGGAGRHRIEEETIAGFVMYRLENGVVEYLLLKKFNQNDWSPPKGFFVAISNSTFWAALTYYLLKIRCAIIIKFWFRPCGKWGRLLWRCGTRSFGRNTPVDGGLWDSGTVSHLFWGFKMNIN